MEPGLAGGVMWVGRDDVLESLQLDAKLLSTKDVWRPRDLALIGVRSDLGCWQRGGSRREWTADRELDVRSR